MKIGIVTFHRALNYGAVLQAYALQQYLAEIGIDSDVLDYRSSYIEHFYKPVKANPVRSTPAFLREILYRKPNVKKRSLFEDFISGNIKTSRVVSSKEELQELQKDYDYIVAGSDQVWNHKWSGFDKAFFLDFCPDYKKFSYAASFGFDKIPSGVVDEYKELLNSFRGFSLRESSGKRIVDDLLSQNESIVSIDPTCLIGADKWRSVAKAPEDSSYVLMYTLEKSQGLTDYAKKLAEKHNLKVIQIVDAIKKIDGIETRGFMSPAEFVGYFMNADYVVTNSFHGLMFSVIFNKQFYLGLQKRQGAPNARLVDFVNDFGLESRVLDDEFKYFEAEIDFSSVEAVMEAKRAESYKYLTSFDTLEAPKKGIQLPVFKKFCCGCRACENVCPTGAITMKEDEEGFLYPIIDKEKCVECKKCLNTCAFSVKKPSDSPEKPLRSVVCYHKNEGTRLHSRSGGAFIGFSDKILEAGGSVYGADFNNDFSVSHKRAEDSVGRDRFCGSKYVQSDTADTFPKVYEDIKNNKKVLYSGTGCQIGGLISYLKSKGIEFPCDNLITVDIICHGVVSPRVWRDNLNIISKENKGEITEVEFRDKSFGWDSHIESYMINNQKVTSTKYTDVFYEHVALRPSCYSCGYASIQREADLTLADAWGIKRAEPEWEHSKGVSLVFANTPKGADLLACAEKDLEVKSADIEAFMQPNMQGPTHRPAHRGSFWTMYNSKGFTAAADYCKARQEKIKKKNKIKGTIVKILRLLHLK